MNEEQIKQMESSSDDALLAEYNRMCKEVEDGEPKKANLTKILDRTKKWLEILENVHKCVEENPNPIEPTFEFQKDEEWRKWNKQVIAHKQKSERINVEKEIEQLEKALDAHYKEMNMQTEAIEACKKELDKRGVRHD